MVAFYFRQESLSVRRCDHNSLWLAGRNTYGDQFLSTNTIPFGKSVSMFCPQKIYARLQFAKSPLPPVRSRLILNSVIAIHTSLNAPPTSNPSALHPNKVTFKDIKGDSQRVSKRQQFKAIQPDPKILAHLDLMRLGVITRRQDRVFVAKKFDAMEKNPKFIRTRKELSKPPVLFRRKGCYCMYCAYIFRSS